MSRALHCGVGWIGCTYTCSKQKSMWRKLNFSFQFQGNKTLAKAITLLSCSGDPLPDGWSGVWPCHRQSYAKFECVVGGRILRRQNTFRIWSICLRRKQSECEHAPIFLPEKDERYWFISACPSMEAFTVAGTYLVAISGLSGSVADTDAGIGDAR
jgi:hypothetical protein